MSLVSNAGNICHHREIGKLGVTLLLYRIWERKVWEREGISQCLIVPLSLSVCIYGEEKRGGGRERREMGIIYVYMLCMSERKCSMHLHGEVRGERREEGEAGRRGGEVYANLEGKSPPHISCMASYWHAVYFYGITLYMREKFLRGNVSEGWERSKWNVWKMTEMKICLTTRKKLERERSSSLKACCSRLSHALISGEPLREREEKAVVDCLLTPTSQAEAQQEERGKPCSRGRYDVMSASLSPLLLWRGKWKWYKYRGETYIKLSHVSCSSWEKREGRRRLSSL